MRACAAATKIAYSEIVRAKRNGCTAFRANGNVHEIGLREWLDDNPKKKRKPATTKSSSGAQKQGAAEALRRLEEQEVATYNAYIVAREEGDEDESASALKQWKDITSSLLSYETKVESGKREAGTLIPRREVIEMAQALMIWINSAISNVLHNTTPLLAGAETPRAAAAIVDPSFREALPIALTYGQRTGKIPSWLAEAAMLATTDSTDHDADLFQALPKNIKLSQAEKKALASMTKKIRAKSSEK